VTVFMSSRAEEYLRRHGWYIVEREPGYSNWSHARYDRLLLVPSGSVRGRYARRLEQMVDDLAEFERRPRAEVWEDLMGDNE